MDDKFEMLLDDPNSHQLMLQLYVYSGEMTMEEFLLKLFDLWFKKWNTAINNKFPFFREHIGEFYFKKNQYINLFVDFFISNNKKVKTSHLLYGGHLGDMLAISSDFKGTFKSKNLSISFKNYNKPSEKMLKKLAKNIAKKVEEKKEGTKIS